jgi:hypothetical protein
MDNTEVYEPEEDMPRIAATPAATADWCWQRWDEWAGTSYHPRTQLFRLLHFAKVPIRWDTNEHRGEEGRSECSHTKEYQRLHPEFIEYGATNREVREPAPAPWPFR